MNHRLLTLQLSWPVTAFSCTGMVTADVQVLSMNDG